MALTQASDPSNSTTRSSSQPSNQQLNLPSPQLFDILPALHELLSRLDHRPTSADGQLESNDSSEVSYTGLQPLDPKDLPTAILPLKSQIRKGLKELEKLPDMDRSVQDQREEIAELETRIKKQEAMFKEMGVAGRSVEQRLGLGR